MAYFYGNYGTGVNTSISETTTDNNNFTNAINTNTSQNIWQSFTSNKTGVLNSIQIKGTINNYIDQDNNIGTSSVVSQSSPYWQSFTAGVTGNVCNILISMSSLVTPYYLVPVIVYSGNGISGPVITTTLVTLTYDQYAIITFTNGQFPVITGNRYTIQVDPNTGTNTVAMSISDNPYPGGQSSFGLSIYFTTFMFNNLNINIFSGIGTTGTLLYNIPLVESYDSLTTNPTFDLSNASLTLTQGLNYTFQLTSVGPFTIFTDTSPSTFNGQSSFGTTINIGFIEIITNSQMLNIKNNNRSISLLVGGNISNNASDYNVTIPNVQVNSNIVLDQGSQIIHGNKLFDSILFNNSQTLYTPTVLNYYEIYPIILSFSGAIPTTTTSAKLIRIGNMTTLQSNRIQVLSTSSNFITGDTIIPTRFIPSVTTDLTFSIIINNNSTLTNGSLVLNNTTFRLTIYNGDVGTNFTNGVTVGFPSFSVNWIN